jgi:hypothetical protein
MIRIGPVSIALLGWIVVSVCFAMLLPSAAQAACQKWDVSGEWAFVQTNGFTPKFTLQQTETGLQGSAQSLHESDNGFTNTSGSVDGDSFEITV